MFCFIFHVTFFFVFISFLLFILLYLCSFFFFVFFFFFQAEDGIRDLYVTGVQTCALPIFRFFVGPLYYVGIDSRFEDKLRKMLQTVGPTKNLRYVLIGRDDPDDIPDDAATYIMSSAREYLTNRYGPTGGPGRPIHPPRVFSDDSARQLLTTLVRANRAALAAGLE